MPAIRPLDYKGYWGEGGPQKTFPEALKSVPKSLRRLAGALAVCGAAATQPSVLPIAGGLYEYGKVAAGKSSPNYWGRGMLGALGMTAATALALQDPGDVTHWGTAAAQAVLT